MIDDDPAVRELMARYLTREGFRVAVAAGGEEGLRLAREISPDAITLDVMMPGTRRLGGARSAQGGRSTTADIPVVMLTIVDDRNLGYALGAAEYLTKPIDRERLLAVLARHRRDRPVLIAEDDAADARAAPPHAGARGIQGRGGRQRPRRPRAAPRADCRASSCST